MGEARAGHRAGGGEWQGDAGVTQDRDPEGGAQAVRAPEAGPGGLVGGGALERLLVERIRGEETGVAVVEDRETELQAGTAPAQPAEVRELVAQPSVERVEGPRG